MSVTFVLIHLHARAYRVESTVVVDEGVTT